MDTCDVSSADGLAAQSAGSSADPPERVQAVRVSPPRNHKIWRCLADAIGSSGGDFPRPSADPYRGGRVIGGGGVLGGEKVRATAPVVVSNVAPAGTVKLLGEDCVPADYLELVKKADRLARSSR